MMKFKWKKKKLPSPCEGSTTHALGIWAETLIPRYATQPWWVCQGWIGETRLHGPRRKTEKKAKADLLPMVQAHLDDMRVSLEEMEKTYES